MGVKKRKIKEKHRHTTSTFLSLLGGALLGLCIAFYSDHIQKEDSTMSIFALLLLILAGVYISIYLQTILHEAGHFLFGRLTGYRFSSFRIGSLLWKKSEGKLRLYRLKIPGTGGQCLMAPPEMQNGTLPYVLYNLGGAILNLLSAVVFAFITVHTQAFPVISILFMMLTLFGIWLGLISAIPIRFKNMNNDGCNVLSLHNNPQAQRAFWIQLKISELNLLGKPLKDMPDEWFEMPSTEAMKNSMTAALGVFSCIRMLEKMDFAAAEQSISTLLSMDTAISEIHRRLLMADWIYCELVGENRPEQLSKLLDAPQKRFMQAMKNYISIMRTEYAYALLSEKDTKKAQNIRLKFESMSKKFPYPIADEVAYMDYALHKSALTET